MSFIVIPSYPLTLLPLYPHPLTPSSYSYSVSLLLIPLSSVLRFSLQAAPLTCGAVAVVGAVVVGAVAVVVVVGAVADHDGAVADDVGRRVGSRGGASRPTSCGSAPDGTGPGVDLIKGRRAFYKKGRGGGGLSAPLSPMRAAPRGEDRIYVCGFRRAATARESNWRCRRECRGGGNQNALPCEFDALCGARASESVASSHLCIYGSGLRFVTLDPRQPEVSKRAWEKSVRQWRIDLKALAADGLAAAGSAGAAWVGRAAPRPLAQRPSTGAGNQAESGKSTPWVTKRTKRPSREH